MILYLIISCSKPAPVAPIIDSTRKIIWRMNQYTDNSVRVDTQTMVGISVEGNEEKIRNITNYAHLYNGECNAEIADYCFSLDSLKFGFGYSGSSIGDRPFGWPAYESTISLLQSCPETVQKNIRQYPQAYREYCLEEPKDEAISENNIVLSEVVYLDSFNDHVEMHSQIDYIGGSLSGTAVWNGASFASRLWRLGLHMSLLCAYTSQPNAVESRLKSQIFSFSFEMSNVGLGTLMYPASDPDVPVPFEVEPLLNHFKQIYPYSKLNGWWYCK